jgi:hypothetical protein
VFATTHIQPVKKPANGETSRRVYSYAAPSTGCQVVNSTKLSAVNSAKTAANPIETTNAEPAYPAKMPVTTKIPPPIMAPTFMLTASQRLSVGLS